MSEPPSAADPLCANSAPRRDGVRLSAEVAREILSSVNGLSFGSVEITVHESRVVQIERRERTRLDDTQAARVKEPLTRGHPRSSTAGDA